MRSTPFSTPALGAVPTTGGVGFLQHCHSVGKFRNVARVDGLNDDGPSSVCKATLLFPGADIVPFCKIRAEISWDPDFLMHAATFIAVFARTI